MQITFPALQSINAAVNLAFNTAFEAAEDVSGPWTFDATSTGTEELYPRLDLIGGIREWTGDRVVEELSVSSFTIPNKPYEKTVSVKRWDIEDDRFGLLNGATTQLGTLTKLFKPLTMTKLLLTGAATKTYDGQNFFDAAHPNPTDAAPGTTVGTVANYYAGTSAPWFMFDTRWAIKPLIWQTRQAFRMLPLFSLTDPVVFNNADFRWGLDGRYGSGFGLWQYAAMSTQPLTAENIVTMRTNMASIKRPDGSPMGLRPDILVCGSGLFPLARLYEQNEFLPPGDPSIVSGQLTPNQARGLFRAVENPWLN